jgi:hypothetical protein
MQATERVWFYLGKHLPGVHQVEDVLPPVLGLPGELNLSILQEKKRFTRFAFYEHDSALGVTAFEHQVSDPLTVIPGQVGKQGHPAQWIKAFGHQTATSPDKVNPYVFIPGLGDEDINLSDHSTVPA